MMPISNDAGVQFIVGQLLPDVVGMPTDLAVRSVAQVGGHARAGPHGLSDGFWFCGCVSEGDHDAAARQPFDEGQRAIAFWGEGAEFDAAFGRFLKPLKLVPVGIAYVFERMRAPWSVFGGDVGAFHMDTR